MANADNSIGRFKKFWVVAVNNYICAASYSGKQLKEKHKIPSFRTFHFIRAENELNYFTKRDGLTNRELVDIFLNSEQEVQASVATEAK